MKIVAEIGNAHEGSLGMALAYIDAVADAGADAVKFQCHDGDPVSEFRPGTFFPQDATRQDYWRRVGFTRNQWGQLKRRARDKGIEFGVSAFCREGVAAVCGLIDFIKVPSGCVTNEEVLENAGSIGVPVVLSTGVATEQEIDRAIDFLHALQRFDQTLTVLECTSEYPTPPEHCLDCDSSRHARGISDHSGTIWPSIVAATRHADMSEVHVCFSRQQWGPDVSSSITIDELRQLVQGVRFIERMRASTVTKDELAAQLADTRRIFGGA